MKLVVLFLLGSCILIIGCQYDPFAGRLTLTKPNLKDIPGTYQLVQETITDSKVNSGILILKGDGSYVADSLPKIIHGFDKTFVSAKGSWDLEIIGGTDTWKGVKDNWGLRLTDIDQFFSFIGFTGEKPPYGLLLTVGDPDEGTVMIFERRK